MIFLFSEGPPVFRSLLPAGRIRELVADPVQMVIFENHIRVIPGRIVSERPGNLKNR